MVIAHGLLDAPITRPRAGSPTDTAAAIAAVPGQAMEPLLAHFVHIGRHLSFANRNMRALQAVDPLSVQVCSLRPGA